RYPAAVSHLDECEALLRTLVHVDVEDGRTGPLSQSVLDHAQGVAPLLQVTDRAQAVEVAAVVPGRSPLVAGRRDQPLRLVRPQELDRDPGLLGQLLDPVLDHVSSNRDTGIINHFTSPCNDGGEGRVGRLIRWRRLRAWQLRSCSRDRGCSHRRWASPGTTDPRGRWS